jgi:hypothetical protein
MFCFCMYGTMISGPRTLAGIMDLSRFVVASNGKVSRHVCCYTSFLVWESRLPRKSTNLS